MNQICFDQTVFLIMLAALIGILMFYHLTSDTDATKCATYCKKAEPSVQIQPIVQVPAVESNVLSQDTQQKITDRDYRAIYDPLAPPTRRSPRHTYPPQSDIPLFDIPTRGYPDNYHYVGNLVRNKGEKFVKLYGRETYPGSNRWEYYGITTDHSGTESKISIETTNNKEIYDGDEINIEMLGLEAGTFKFYENEYDRPRYNPYLF